MNSLSRTQKPRAGFTLLEVMVVIVILGVLASLVVPKPVGQQRESRSAKSHQRYRGAGKRTGYVPTG
ncbi:general secretion pathway protein G precursor (epsG-like) [Escherichia coli]|nr:general secretion pathway protein G precursor (epsG-like) [Escherichia coli]